MNDDLIEAIADTFPGETEFFVLTAADMNKVRAAIEAAGGKEALGLSDVVALPVALERELRWHDEVRS